MADPRLALEAWENDSGLIREIIEYRSYKRNKDLYDENKHIKDLERRHQGPGIDWVREIDFEFAREAMIEKRRQIEEATGQKV